MAIADELIALLGYELTGEEKARQYEGTLNRLESAAQRVGEAIGTAIKVGAVAAVAGLSWLGKGVLQTSAQFETYQATLETIEGSAEKAKQSLDWISQFAKTTPYDVAGVTAAFVKLKAYGIDPIANDTLRILGDTSAAMGKPLMQAVEALADAQTGEFERLKEFGLKAKQKGDEVTFSWTKNGKELTKTVKKSATDIRNFLLETMGDRFAGAMDRQSRTWNGIMSNIGDTWTMFQKRIGDAGFFDKAKAQLQRFLDALNRLDEEGKIDEWAKAISYVLGRMVDMFAAVASRIGENVRFLIDNFEALKPYLISIGIVAGLLLAWSFPVITALAAIGLAVDDLMAYLQGADSVTGDFIAWIKRIPKALEDTAASIKASWNAIDWNALGQQAGRLIGDGIIAALFAWAGSLQSIYSLIASAFSSIGSQAAFNWREAWNAGMGNFAAEALLYVASAYLKMVQNLSSAALSFLTTAASNLIPSWLGGFISLIGNSLQFLVGVFEGLGSQLGNALLRGLQSVGQAIKDWFLNLFSVPDWVKPFFGLDRNLSPSEQAQPKSGSATGGGSSAPIEFDQAAWDAKMAQQKEEWQKMLSNAGSNIAKMAPDQAVNATITDARTDARSFPVENNVTVNQTVTQASDAPGQAAQATGDAVSGSLSGQRSQIETEPSF